MKCLQLKHLQLVAGWAVAFFGCGYVLGQSPEPAPIVTPELVLQLEGGSMFVQSGDGGLVGLTQDDAGNLTSHGLDDRSMSVLSSCRVSGVCGLILAQIDSSSEAVVIRVEKDSTGSFASSQVGLFTGVDVSSICYCSYYDVAVVFGGADSIFLLQNPAARAPSSELVDAPRADVPSGVMAGSLRIAVQKDGRLICVQQNSPLSKPSQILIQDDGGNAWVWVDYVSNLHRPVFVDVADGVARLGRPMSVRTNGHGSLGVLGLHSGHFEPLAVLETNDGVWDGECMLPILPMAFSEPIALGIQRAGDAPEALRPFVYAEYRTGVSASNVPDGQFELSLDGRRVHPGSRAIRVFAEPKAPILSPATLNSGRTAWTLCVQIANPGDESVMRTRSGRQILIPQVSLTNPIVYGEAGQALGFFGLSLPEFSMLNGRVLAIQAHVQTDSGSYWSSEIVSYPIVDSEIRRRSDAQQSGAVVSFVQSQVGAAQSGANFRLLSFLFWNT